MDASCYLFLPAAYGLLGTWALMPPAIAPVGDRLFFLRARASGLAAGRTRRPSVNCVAAYAAVYEALGEAAPPEARALPDHAGYRAWIDALSPDALVTLRAQVGVDVRDLYPSATG